MTRRTASRAAVSLAGAVAALVAAGGAAWPGPAQARGSIKGIVRLARSAPAAQVVPIYKDASVCGKHKRRARVIVDGGKGLRDVVLYLEDAPRGAAATPATRVLDQRRCEYVPHVLAARKGTRLEIRNSDPILHNVHAVVGQRDAFNVVTPIMGQKVYKTLRKLGLNRVGCDAGHTWMRAYVYVFDHPYFAVSGADGQFRIDGVPEGRYRLVAWHETLGTLRRQIVVGAGAKAPTVELSFH